MPNSCCKPNLDNQSQRSSLRWLLAINSVMFVSELSLGWFAESTALIADSLDMLADTFIYSLAIYAVGRCEEFKISAAETSGIVQMGLGLLVCFDILRRILGSHEPEPIYMILVGLVALAANTICLMLIAKHRKGEIHMRASWIFSRNDVIANLGVIGSGALVAWTGLAWPDIIIGFTISALIIYGGIAIIADINHEKNKV